MITRNQEKGLKRLNKICNLFLDEAVDSGINADVLSLIFYDKKKSIVIHGSSCLEWSMASLERNPLKEDNLIEAANPKYEISANSKWEKIAQPFFAADSSINEHNSSNKLYTLETNGIVGVCINSANTHPDQKAILNKIALKAAYEVKGKTENMRLIENCAESIESESLVRFRNRHDEFLRNRHNQNRSIRISNLPHLMIGEIKLKPVNVATIIALHEKWTPKQRLDQGISQGKVSRLVNKVGDLKSLIRELTDRNILSNMPSSSNFTSM